MSKYPIGAEWAYIDIDGSRGSVWLDDINKNFEVWRWSYQNIDGSGHVFDWTTNKAAAVSECKSAFRSERHKIRFKRVITPHTP